MASHLAARGVSPHYIRTLLGHADVSQTISVYGSHLHADRSPVLDTLDE